MSAVPEVGDIVQVHFIVFAGPDKWISARVIRRHQNSFDVQALSELFPGKEKGGYELMCLSDDRHNWRKP